MHSFTVVSMREHRSGQIRAIASIAIMVGGKYAVQINGVIIFEKKIPEGEFYAVLPGKDFRYPNVELPPEAYPEFNRVVVDHYMELFVNREAAIVG